MGKWLLLEKEVGEGRGADGIGFGVGGEAGG